jgi:cyclohexanone monooxygenase
MTIQAMAGNVAPSPTKTVDVAVVGAGLAGLYMTHKLVNLGYSVQGLERGPGVGGTWYWNTYPGARCDVESVDYSYSFSRELEQDWEWTERFPTQPELLKYINHVADRFDLRSRYAFGTHIVRAEFDEQTKKWTVTAADGQAWTAKYVVMASGSLSTGQTPDIPGIDSFQGPTYHTSQWPAGGADFTGLKVAILGTGSSGVQAIPMVARQAKHLTVLQRTPNYVLPARNRQLSKDELASIKADYRARRALARRSQGGVAAEPPTLSAFDVSETERNDAFETAWLKGGTVMTQVFKDTGRDEEANALLSEFLRGKIREAVIDPETAEKLVPTGYPFGAKRPCVGTDYYETFNRDNVSLIDIKSDQILEFTPGGIRFASGEQEFDAVIFATGFDAITGPMTAVDIRGTGGQRVVDKWADGPHAYLGLGMNGFPNLFMVTGPGSPSVLSNMMVSIEQHIEWIADAIEHVETGGHSTIEPSEEAERQWGQIVNDVAAKTLYMRGNSWYNGANIPGKARVFMLYAGGAKNYRDICNEVAADGYRGFAIN